MACQKSHKIRIYGKSSAWTYGFRPWKTKKKRISISKFSKNRPNCCPLNLRLSVLLSAFQRSLYRFYLLHWHSQDLRQLKTFFRTRYTRHWENTPNWIIPNEKLGNFPAISADNGVSFRLFCALYSHKARCLNQWERALYWNLIIKRNNEQ